MKWIYLTVGGVAGTFARYWLAGSIYAVMGTEFPWGTLIVNVTGCLFIGLFNSLAEFRFLLGPNERLLAMTGFCGAYTTFSTLILETSTLLRDGEVVRGFLNLTVSAILGLAFFWIGDVIGKAL